MQKPSIKTAEDITLLRKGGAVLARILDEVTKNIAPGDTTQDIEDAVMECIERYKVEPLILGYHPEFAPRPYPAASCVSINDVLVHGIPNESPETIVDGDVVSVDVVIGYEGLVLDSARTIGVGTISSEASNLLEVTKKALDAGIKAARPGNTVRDIGAAIEAVVPEGFGIVEDLCGHGVGYALHEPPNIPNFVMKGKTQTLHEGMVVAIEPMITSGKKEVIFDKIDGYTVRTADGSLGAHMEHTVLITKKGPEILTKA